MANRNVVLGLLEKCGASFTEKISMDRAVTKLQRNWHPESETPNNTIVGNLNGDELEVLKELGLSPTSGIKIEDAPPKVETKPNKKIKVPKAPKSPKPKKEKMYKPSWIECAAKAILKNKSMKDAATATVILFKETHRKSSLKCDSLAGTIFVSRVSKVLIMVGKIQVEGDVIKHL